LQETGGEPDFKNDQEELWSLIEGADALGLESVLEKWNQQLGGM
jgi:hypothetical protein